MLTENSLFSPVYKEISFCVRNYNQNLSERIDFICVATPHLKYLCPQTLQKCNAGFFCQNKLRSQKQMQETFYLKKKKKRVLRSLTPFGSIPVHSVLEKKNLVTELFKCFNFTFFFLTDLNQAE